MKKLCILLLTLVLVCTLCSCGLLKTVFNLKNNFEFTLPAETIAYPESVEHTAEYIPTEIAVPDVITADSYEKVFADDYDWSFTHSVIYPKIDSDKPGAAAINKEISDIYGKIISELKNNQEGGMLYTVEYSSSVLNGIIFIHIKGYTGLYGSEGYYHQRLFYYDVAADSKTTPEEYASRAKIDLEKAKENILYSHALANEYMEDTAIPVDGARSVVASPEKGKIYPAKQSKFDYEFDGVELVDNEVHMYYHGQEYILLNFDFVLDRVTLMPKDSHYICTLPTDATDTDTFKFTFENGIVTGYSVPKECGIRAIKVSSTEVTIDTVEILDSISFSINGGEKQPFYNWASLEDGTLHTSYLDTYIAPEEIRTIEFFDFTPRTKVKSSEIYTKKAIDILGYGGIDFTHTVSYPIIDSKKSGAAALNQKIAEKYEKIITKLKTNAEENELFNISYDANEYDNILIIKMNEHVGWQYSECSSDITVYYYDAENDREMSAEEYLTHFGINLDTATDRVLYSSRLFESMLYDESKPNTLYENIGGEKCNNPQPNILYFSKAHSFNDSVKFIGAEVRYDEVYMYYTGRYYVQSVLCVPLHRDSLAPVHPHYEGYVLTDTSPSSDFDHINILFKDNRITGCINTDSIPVFKVGIASEHIKLYSNEHIENISILINDMPVSGGSSSYGDENGAHIREFYIDSYYPLEILEKLTIALSQE